MSNVVLAIGGRNFTVASAAGEESHIEMLGRMIDDRLKAMGGALGQSETRMLLFAALVLADELHEAHKGTPAAAPSPAVIQRVEALAARVEKLAESISGMALEQAPPRA